MPSIFPRRNSPAWLVTVALLPAAVAADVFTGTDDYRFDEIVPLSLVAPPRPTSRFGPGPEGWVVLHFSIMADGSTTNVEVLDAMPETFRSGDVVDAVEEWTFQPAHVNGAAVDWHNNTVVFNADLAEIPNISGPRFSTPYTAVQAMVNEGNLDQAAREAEANLREATYSLHDIGLGNMQLALVQMQRQDMHLAHQAITRATLPEVTQLTTEELDVALQYRFIIELALGRYMEALDSYQRRDELAGIPAGDVMMRQVAEIREALEGDITLGARGKILDRERGWYFIPSRRTFTLGDVTGDLDAIRVVCNQRIATLQYQPDVEWSLPANWGVCSLTVVGARNSTFTLYEFPG